MSARVQGRPLPQQRGIFEAPPPPPRVLLPARRQADLVPDDQGREVPTPDQVRDLLAGLTQSCGPPELPAPVRAPQPQHQSLATIEPAPVLAPPLTLLECISAQQQVCRLIAAKDYAAAEALAHQVLIGLAAAVPTKKTRRKRS